MTIPKWLTLASASALINVCCIVLLCMNLIQNHVSIHERAIRQSATMTLGNDDPPVVSSANGSLRGTVTSDNTRSAISMATPRGKAVALPSIRITEEEEKNINIDRNIYGGKGDKPHLGGFTEFDVSAKLHINGRTDCDLSHVNSVLLFLFQPMGVSPSLWKYMVCAYRSGLR